MAEEDNNLQPRNAITEHVDIQHIQEVGGVDRSGLLTVYDF